VIRKLAGVAEGSELHSRIAGETNQEFLNAVSFSKGTKPTVLVLDN
jgi:hypothetical protein